MNETVFEIGNGGFLKIDGNASIEIDGVEINPKTIKEGYLPIHGDFITGKLNIEPKVWLTVEEARKIAYDLLVYEQLYRGAINASSTSEPKTSEIVFNLQKRIEQAEKQK